MIRNIFGLRRIYLDLENREKNNCQHDNFLCLIRLLLATFKQLACLTGLTLSAQLDDYRKLEPKMWDVEVLEIVVSVINLWSNYNSHCSPQLNWLTSFKCKSVSRSWMVAKLLTTNLETPGMLWLLINSLSIIGPALTSESDYQNLTSLVSVTLSYVTFHINSNYKLAADKNTKVFL